MFVICTIPVYPCSPHRNFEFFKSMSKFIALTGPRLIHFSVEL